MSIISFILFPRKIDWKGYNRIVFKDFYNKEDLIKLGIDFPEDLPDDDELLQGLYISGVRKTKINGNFTNKYMYSLAGTFYLLNGYDLVNDINTKISRKQLYAVIDKNIDYGECVEVYSEWLDDEWKEQWGEPDCVKNILLEDIFDKNKFDLDESKVKIVIRKQQKA